MDTCLRRLCPHRRQQRLDAHDVHDAREVVGQYVQSHLGSNPGQRPHQEVVALVPIKAPRAAIGNCAIADSAPLLLG